MSQKVARLINQFSPDNYQLTLKIDPEKLTFEGQVKIKGKRSGKPSKRFTFHQKELKITNATILSHTKNGDQAIAVKRINNQNSLDEVRLHSDSLIVSGNYTIAMDFKGTITKPMNGIYPCFFKHNGEDKKLIATQFESHHAREAFPCIDEPEAKASYDLTLISPSGQTVLSNTPVKNQTESNGLVTSAFETTPKMSSYLLAFVIGDMDYMEATAKNGVKVSCYATPDQKDKLAFSVDVAVKSLEFFEDYFQIKYPLEKLDMVALPDFSSGAMENWGLITYRESAMLIDDQSSSVESKQHVALVIAHEMSHQWFGNLVTMRWWDDLWLNESFANMMEYRAIDEIFPEWHIFESFVAHEGFSAKRRDSLKDVQSVHCDVAHPDEISTLFDPSIVYAKGGTLLYMLMNYVGEEAFKKGLTDYFNEHQYANTEADDLWRAISKSSGKNINQLMQNWLTKPGYPIVEVNWEPGTKTVSLKQKRFLNNPNNNPGDTVWQLPIASNLKTDINLLSKESQELKINEVSSKALILNNEGKSYFIPTYHRKNHLDNIIDDIKDSEISVINRLLLLDNYNLVQRAGNVHTTDLIELAKAYKGETSETVWSAIALALSEAGRLIEHDTKEEKALNEIVLGIMDKLPEQLGWLDSPNDDSQTLRLRSLINALAVGNKSQEHIKTGLKMFRDMKKPSDLPASTRSTVYACASIHGNEADFSRLLDMYSSNLSAEEKEEVASAICETRDQKHITQLIDLLKTDLIRRQNLMSWFASLLRNRHSRADAWKWLVSNWQWIEEQFASDKSFGYFARIAGSIFTKPEEQKQFIAFFYDKKDIVALKRDIQLASQEIESRVIWRQRNQDNLRKMLSS